MQHDVGLIEHGPASEASPRERKIMRVRSMVTLCIFAAAVVVALAYPLIGLAMCCCCLIVYLKPEASGTVGFFAPGGGARTASHNDPGGVNT